MSRAALTKVGCALALVFLSACSGAAAKPETATPKQVLLVGDSFTHLYGQQAAAELRTRGYSVDVVGVQGAGLLDVGRCDGSYARALAATYHPDLTVIEYTGNYNIPRAGPRFGGPPFFFPCQPLLEYGTEAFFRAWKRSANRTTTAFKGRVAWMLVPSTTREPFRSAIPRLNSIYRTIATTRAPTSTVDAWARFGGASFNAKLHDPGELHPNDLGIAALSRLVVEAVVHR
jgi:hypothetical protein